MVVIIHHGYYFNKTSGPKFDFCTIIKLTVVLSVNSIFFVYFLSVVVFVDFSPLRSKNVKKTEKNHY